MASRADRVLTVWSLDPKARWVHEAKEALTELMARTAEMASTVSEDRKGSRATKARQANKGRKVRKA